MPASLQAFISSLLIGREAFDTSISPRANFLKPPPVPAMPTVTLTAPCFDFWNSSATASATGKTVLEPSTRTVGAWARAVPAVNRAAVNRAAADKEKDNTLLDSARML